MTDRTCARGCTRRGEHYAACIDYGRNDGDCRGCVLDVAREGAIVCNRCYGRLRRALEQAPDLIEHMRSRMTGVGAKQYDRIPTGGGRRGASEPASVEILDASRDIMESIYVPGTPASASPAEWRDAAREGALRILREYDHIANSVNEFTQWWELVMPHEIEGHPDFWTIGRARARWPLEDRRRRARKPCPQCDLLDVVIVPPAAPRASSWYTCQSCTWERSEHDDGGRWVAMLGPYDPNAAAPTDHVESADPVPEWDDPLLSRTEADQVAGSASTLRRWLQHGLIEPSGVIVVAGRRTTFFRRSDLLQIKANQSTKQRVGRPPRDPDRSQNRAAR